MIGTMPVSPRAALAALRVEVAARQRIAAELARMDADIERLRQMVDEAEPVDTSNADLPLLPE